MMNFSKVETLKTLILNSDYCTEFIVKLHNIPDFDQENLRNTLLQMGDSLVLVQDEELVKVPRSY